MSSLLPVISWLLIVLFWAARAGADDAQPPTVRDPALRAEMLARRYADQAARKALVEFMQRFGPAFDPQSLSSDDEAEHVALLLSVAEADRANTAWLKEITGRHGWPTISLVGKEAAAAAWLLVQHADFDPKFQRACLERMEKQPSTEVSRRHVAYLTDRVLINEGKPQRYGTQFERAGGRWRPKPLEDEAGVDQRRAAMDLPPIAEYARSMEKAYGSTPK